MAGITLHYVARSVSLAARRSHKKTGLDRAARAGLREIARNLVECLANAKLTNENPNPETSSQG